jgi:hypothetical protein
MDIIRGKQVLNSIIKECLWDCPEDNIQFPKSLFFCEGIGQPTFKITIEKLDRDQFIDGDGNKWVKTK